MKEPVRLRDIAPDLERILTYKGVGVGTPVQNEEYAIRREMVWVTMRDGVRLATDLYFPRSLPATSVALRTPYGRAAERFKAQIAGFVRYGYLVISQDCRGTGD